jgi:DNA polymerase-1
LAPEAAGGSGTLSERDILAARLDQALRDIYEQNGGREFNPNSPRQVAAAVFGEGGEGESTARDVLDALAGAGNRMADLVLRYRRARSDLRRVEKRAENRKSGIHVDDFHRMPSRTGNGTSASSPPPLRTDDDDTAAATAADVADVTDMASMTDGERGQPLLLVDASAYIFRAYYSMPPLHRQDGMPVGAVLGFCNMLNKLVMNRLLSGELPRIVLVFDSKGKTFRHELYPDYKANRPPCPEDLVPQFDLIRGCARAYGIAQIEAPAYEADDVIATLARMATEEGIDVNILTGDKDLMQLVTPPGASPAVHMIDPKEMIRVTHNVVLEKWGVPPALLGDLLALAGDSADNVPGVPGIGPKIASALINDFGSLESLLERAEEIKQKGRREKVLGNAEQARLSRALVELDTSVPLDSMTMPENFTTVSELRMEAISGDNLLLFYENMGFSDMVRRWKGRLSGFKGSEETASVAKSVDPEELDSRLANSGDRVQNDGMDGIPGLSNSSDEDESQPSTALNEIIRQGLLMHNRRRIEPPDPNDFKDVPF